MTFTLNWGIMGPGRIAKTFLNDLLYSKDELRKEVLSGDIQHKLVAIASSSSLERAQTFKEQDINAGSDSSISVYGSYDGIYNDSNVDVIYIATPNLNHFQLCYNVLEHGKHVLLEKPMTVTSEQAKILFDLAKKKGLFLMEAYWTKFTPVYRDVYDYIFGDSEIGPVKRVVADLSFTFLRDDPGMERIYNPALGGGVTPDIGIYSLYWVLGFLDKDAKNKYPEITSQANLADTGVDISMASVLKYDGTLGVATCSGYFTNKAHQVVINCTKGRVEVDDSCEPNEYWIYNADNELIKHRQYKFDGRGMFFEADHVASCLSSGLLESPLHSADHTLRMMQVIDTIHKQCNVVYPAGIQKTTI